MKNKTENNMSKNDSEELKHKFRNNYDPDTPEWQLCENYISQGQLVASYYKDLE
jgi:hypothetical protein